MITLGILKMKGVVSEKVRIQALIAGILSGILYYSIGVLSILSGQWSAADKARVIIGSLLVAYSLFFYISTRGKQLISEIRLAFSSLVFLITVPGFAFCFLLYEESLAERITVSVVLGLFLHYSVLRLSPGLGVLIGLSVTCLSLFVIHFGEAVGLIRAALFLFSANIAGLYVAYSFSVKDNSEIKTRDQIKREWSRQRSAKRFFDDAIADHERWLATVSHELNQPISVARSQSTHLLTALSADKADLDNVRLLASKITKNLLEINEVLAAIFSRAEGVGSLLRLRLGWVRIADVLSGAIEHIGPECTVNPKLSGNYKTDLDGYYVYTDLYLLKRILRNFIENAIKYSPEHSARIEIRAGRRRSGISILIVNSLVADGKLSGDQVREHGVGGLRLGLGLGVGSRFIKVTKRALPGHTAGFRIFRSKFAVSRLAFRSDFTSISNPSLFREEKMLKICIFSDNLSVVGAVSAEAARIGLHIYVYPLAELSGQLGFEATSNYSSFGSLFFVEVTHGFLHARDYFGDDLHLTMRCFGRFIFISEIDLDVSFRDLGMFVRFPAGISGVFDQFNL